jgi:endonuclease/exonuclease/phosphatase family metal-dependent hydrolase
MGDTKQIKKLSLLTFNTLGTPLFAPYITKRYRKTAQLINESDADIVFLQEIFTYYHFYLFQKKLTKFPYAIYQKNFYGPLGGLVIFSKIPLTDPAFKTFSFPKKAVVPWYTRVMRHGILSAKVKNVPVRVATTHLSSDNVHDLTPKNTLYNLIKSQSEETAAWVNQYSSQEESLVLAGDFNIAKNSQLYQDLLVAAKITDAYAKADTPTYFPDRVSYFYQAPKDRCDFIFYKNGKKKLKIQTTDHQFVERELLSNGDLSYLSDHIGLHCILEVNK